MEVLGNVLSTYIYIIKYSNTLLQFDSTVDSVVKLLAFYATWHGFDPCMGQIFVLPTHICNGSRCVHVACCLYTVRKERILKWTIQKTYTNHSPRNTSIDCSEVC